MEKSVVIPVNFHPESASWGVQPYILLILYFFRIKDKVVQALIDLKPNKRKKKSVNGISAFFTV